VVAVTVLLYGVDLLWNPLPAGASELFQKFASSVVFLGAAVLCAVKARTSRAGASAWWLLALAMLLWGLGSTYYSLVLWDREVVPVPSIADGFWIVFYLPVYVALYRLLRQQVGSFPRGARFDVLVACLVVGGAGATVLFEHLVHSTHGSPAQVALDLAYPLGDLGLVALVAAAITVTGWKAAGIWHWIAPAFAIFAVADTDYLLRIADGSYAVGGIIDLGWPLAALLVGAAAWRSAGDDTPAPRPRSTMRVVVPAVSGAAALALLVADHFKRINPVTLVLAAISLFLIVARLCVLVGDNRRLLARSRREATTDSLTGLGNRRQLTAELAAAVERLDPDRPLTLTLFDLDGFKEYNDTFGHVAGDRLLERLGTRLRNAAGGTAYRMGGDEFCTLESAPDRYEATAGAEAAAATLAEHGEGFSVSCSHGTVTLPDETTDPIDALRIADRRMYNHKGRGRASAARQSSDVLLRALAERDSDLHVHLGGVADLAGATATRMGASDRDTEAVRQTALLHDVGKVAIPDEILSKPGPLDAAEWVLIKRHTIIGERIIAAAPALARVATCVRSTHERFDGCGYPDGLGGEDIPLPARIVAVCDAYDAMTTKRAYRDPLDDSDALAELRRCAGAQFDPQVVDAFTSALAATRDPQGPLVTVAG
jgi:diguanylate cyclase (GGDEF)-like protein